MTTKTIWIAWDGERFDTFKECEEYEKKYQDAVDVFLRAYHFYDALMNEQLPFSSGLGETLEWIFNRYNDCSFLRVTEKIPRETLKLICSVDGIILPSETGLYHYQWELSEGWVKED